MRQLPVWLIIVVSFAIVASASVSVGSDSGTSPLLPSHITLHQHLPPAELLTPLAGKDAELLKGLCRADEAIIADRLREVSLNQRLLRVAVGEADGLKAALVKFQAGNELTGQFRLNEIEADAVAALNAAFSANPAIRHTDVWAVIPSEANAGGQSHRPIFSVAADRNSYRLSKSSGKTDSELVRSLGVIRYDPLLLTYASDNCTEDAGRAALPVSAYTAPRAGYGHSWQQALKRNAYPASSQSGQQTTRIMLHGDRGRPLVAITIDDGPCPMLTPLLLAVLAKEKAVANFFVVGEKAEQYPQLLRDIAEADHLIGNHSYHHRRLAELSAQQIGAELDACQTIVGRLAGQVMKYLRPPGGNYNRAVIQCAQARRQTITLWTHNAGDWANPPVQQIVNRCLTNIQPGSIILMHGGDLNSVRALPLIIQGLRARGLQPATLSQMHGNNTPELLTIDAALHLPQNGWKPDEVK